MSPEQACFDQIDIDTRSEPAQLNGILRGELSWIVMKALEKDP